MTLREKLEQLRIFGADGGLKDSELDALIDVALEVDAAHEGLIDLNFLPLTDALAKLDKALS